MADVSLRALPQKGFARVFARLIGLTRARLTGPAAIDPDALSDHMQRDLGFRDGRSNPTPNTRAVGAFARR